MSSSRPAEQQVVQHFTHIHPLTKVDGYGEFTCGGCKTYGFGKTYRCTWCDYNLHDHCATCPSTLVSFMHPQHELRLVFREPEHTQQNKRMCDICDESAEGLYYQCEPCGFDVHPLCTQLPQHVRHVPHPAHPLELSQWGASSICMVCRGAIRSWRYKCGPCGLDVHMECVNSSASVAATEIQQRCFGPPQPQYYHSQYYYHQPYYNHGYTNQGQVHGYTNQGQVQESGTSTGRKMFSILMALTVGVVCNIIAGPAVELLNGCF
ncbi:Protein kinase C-like phorbol ester/diacylglycerol-binding domain [Arabidopsis thaliana x Arabidopsis arenosa]|uniref:Protein kinase C-like phorbol ester/diacylglycerol-binding domain n=1 Tax=Arabidopsis thaliana x Arabidopsis arenosa TaxID=1240361 RepID=A0A8T2A8T9_9BRAS|nr:Protein kinase C-like phorbol ester/diacylglycerol-binding domain [Arabidopsis thaliana x Arabidopsis arenosa]